MKYEIYIYMKSYEIILTIDISCKRFVGALDYMLN